MGPHDTRKISAKRMNKMAELKPREQKLVMEVINGKDPQDAAVAVGLPARSGPMLMAQPRVQNAFQEQLYRLYPDVHEKISHVVMGILENPKARPGDILKAVDTLAKLLGLNAPTKHLRVGVGVGAEAAKKLWPGQEEPS